MIRKKKRPITEPRSLPPRPQQPRIPFSAWIRIFLLGSVSVVACGWAIWRHYRVPRMPMVVPVAPVAPADAGQGNYEEIEVEPPP